MVVGDTRVVRNGEAQRRGRVAIPLASTGASHNWSDANRPQAYASEEDWLARLPVGVPIYALSRGSSSFKTNFNATIAAVAGSGRLIIDLRNPFGNAETFHLTSFGLIGSSGSQTYAFGLYDARFAGFIGHGWDKTKIQMDAGSITTAQLNAMKTMTKASFAPLQMGVARFYSAAGQPFYLGGVGFQSADQPLLTEVASDMTDNNPVGEVPVFTPQPAPHQGVCLAGPGPATISHCAFIGVGRALISQPPFEMANFTTQYGTTYIYNTEFDGRRAASIDPARPRRCTVLMGNNETVHYMEYVWLHHANVSRYAVNDENQNTFGQYTVKFFKIEHMSETRNTDPNLNDGEVLGGASPITPFGWESCAGTILVQDGYIDQEIDWTYNGQAPAHFQMTTVGGRNPQGGRFKMERVSCTYTGYPEADGYIIGRIGYSSYWNLDGYDNTIEVYHPISGVRLLAKEFTGTWPPDDTKLGGNFRATHWIAKRA